MKVSIPTPCHENWDNMTRKETGSFCGVCSKVVVDFTKMKKDKIKQYFIDKSEEKTCGRFLESQLHVPEKRSRYNKIWLPKFAFALYVVFGMTLFSCGTNENTPLVGEIETIEHYDNEIIKDSLIKPIDSVLQNLGQVLIRTGDQGRDSISEIEPVKLGEIKIDKTLPVNSCNPTKPDSFIKNNIIIKGDVIAYPEEIFMGDVDIEEEEPIKEEMKIKTMGMVMIRD